MSCTERSSLLPVFLLPAILLADATAQEPGPQEQEPSASPSAAAEGEAIHLRAGRSHLLALPWPVRGVSITDPAVADVQIASPERVLVSGKKAGSTDVLVWNDAGDARSHRVEVAIEIAPLQAEARRAFPTADIALAQDGEVVVVSGQLHDADQAAQLHQWLEARGLNYVDLSSIPGVQQVQVVVRVAEVSRTGIRALGVNAFHAGDDFFLGSTIGPSGGPLNPINIGPPTGAPATGDVPFTFNSAVNVSPAVTLFAGIPGADLEVFIQALVENQYLRLLAEPNLVALSGEEASFLAGGEFPIPVVQGSGGAGNSSITIEYKEFGVGLKFLPIVLGDGKIRLAVHSEVSEISDIGALEIQGFRIPAVVTRRAVTTLEMGSGQTFAMAGLLSQNVTAQVSRTPYLSSIPILGSLFRSVRYRRGETELLVLVTASLVEPVSENVLPPLPGDDHLVPSDWELYSLGRMEGRAPGRLSPDSSNWIKARGLDRLRGPGAWATHETSSPEAREPYADSDSSRE